MLRRLGLLLLVTLTNACTLAHPASSDAVDYDVVEIVDGALDSPRSDIANEPPADLPLDRPPVDVPTLDVRDVPIGPDVMDVIPCPPPSLRCTGVCINVSSDPAHCGSCTNVCGVGMGCVRGVCQPACPSGQTLCGTTCVATSTNPANCGSCGHQCVAGAQCVGGACRCPTGETACSTGCANLANDTNHCGACSSRCAGLNAMWACQAGQCVVTGCIGTASDCNGLASDGCECANGCNGASGTCH